MEYRNNLHNKGTAVVDIVLLIAILGAAGWAGKNFLFSKDKERAKESITATESLLDAQQNQTASVAASVTAIATANELAPESPSKAFITREVPEALALLPEPTEIGLKAAQMRRIAVMEGNLIEANRLYVQLSERNADLVAERDAAIQRRIKADKELMDAAKDKAFTDLQRDGLLILAIVVAFGWVTRAKQSVPLAVLGQAIGSANRPPELVRELDALLTPGQQRVVGKAAKINTPSDDART